MLLLNVPALNREGPIFGLTQYCSFYCGRPHLFKRAPNDCDADKNIRLYLTTP